MKPSLLATKLYVPSLRSKWVQRPHLMRRLDEGLAAGHQLTLVSAPAGFGKTACVSEWVQDVDLPVTWLSLDASDNDPGRFFAYLIAALQKVDEEVGQEIEAMLQTEQFPPIEMLTTALLNDILDMGSFFLVLDDFQVIREAAILKAVEKLLVNQPRSMHLVLVTREDPPLALARLRANNLMTEVRAGELRFTQPEAGRFLTEVLGLSLSSVDVAVLTSRTEGWIAGLQLAGLSLRDRADPSQFIAGLSGSHRFILSYLTEEVLDGQPEEMARFLLETSILDKLSGDLCAAVTGRADAAALLASLFSANLFLISLDDEQRWYRYHRLFGDLLASRLRQSLPAQAIRELHVRASDWLAQNDELDQAIWHALAGEDTERAASLVEREARPLIFGGRVRTLRNWLAALPEAAVQSHPRLNVYRVWIDLIEGKLDFSAQAMQERLNMFRALLPSADNDRLRLEFMVILSRFVALAGNSAGAIRLAEEALARLPAEDLASRARIHSALAIAYELEGHAEKAAAAYGECLRLAQASGYYAMAAHTTMMRAIWRWNYGQLRESARLSQSIVDMGAQAGQMTFFPAGEGYLGLAGVYLEWNELQAAENYLQQGMELCRQGGLAGPATAHVLKARLLQARGDLQGALAEAEAVEAYYGGGDPGMLARQILIRLAMGDVHEAARVAASWMHMLSDPAVTRPPLLVVEDIQATVARVLLAQGDAERALQLLDKLQATAGPGGRNGRLIEAHLLRALALQEQNSGCLASSALGSFQRALGLAQPEGYVLLFVEVGPTLVPLLQAVARDAGATEPLRQYARKLLEAFGLRDGLAVELPAAAGELIEPLTPRELEVLQLIYEGCSNRDIARRLVISMSAAKKHVANIYGKLNVNSRTQALARARQLGLLPL